MANEDEPTVEGFGQEWAFFDQTELAARESSRIFELYFSVFPWPRLAHNAVGFDLGCGSGRWARHVAPRVGQLHCVDASDVALSVARKNLSASTNVAFHHASVDGLPFAEASMDFGYSLGVLHHVPDTAAGICSCVRLLKPGAPFLIYLYYRFDNRPAWFQSLWGASEIGRRAISQMPFAMKRPVTDLLAASVYWPLARSARFLARRGLDVSNWPLASYRDASFYTMRTDSLDRFGTRLEQRFTREEIRSMLENAGLDDVTFSDGEPFWCAVGYKR